MQKRTRFGETQPLHALYRRAMVIIMKSFELKRLTDYSDEQVLAEVRRVAGLVSDSIVTITAFLKLSRVSKSTLRRRFGTWQNTLVTAGLGHRYGGHDVTLRMRSQPAKTMSDENVLDEIRAVARQVGRQGITVEDFNAYSRIGARTVRRRFGSWRGGLLRAGLNPVKHGRRYTDEECFENLLAVWTHYGRPPQYQAMACPPSIVGPKAYLVRWKTWSQSLQAFVDYVNRDKDESPGNDPIAQPTVTTNIGTKPIPEHDRQKIKLGLRYKVLLRDHFRCVLCGSSPAVDQTCKLHVDHITPWSRGGKTVIENLRSLCEHCNLGKGNRFDSMETQVSFVAERVETEDQS